MKRLKLSLIGQISLRKQADGTSQTYFASVESLCADKFIFMLKMLKVQIF
jgi:hypothetical protein